MVPLTIPMPALATSNSNRRVRKSSVKNAHGTARTFFQSGWGGIIPRVSHYRDITREYAIRQELATYRHVGWVHATSGEGGQPMPEWPIRCGWSASRQHNWRPIQPMSIMQQQEAGMCILVLVQLPMPIARARPLTALHHAHGTSCTNAQCPNDMHIHPWGGLHTIVLAPRWIPHAPQ